MIVLWVICWLLSDCPNILKDPNQMWLVTLIIAFLLNNS